MFGLLLGAVLGVMASAASGVALASIATATSSASVTTGQRAFFTMDDHLRAEPSPGARQLGRIGAGERVTAHERRGFWRRVETARGAGGWVRLSSLRVSAAAPAAGLAALDSGRAAAGNVVLTSGTRSVPGRNAPLNREALKSARADAATAAALPVALRDDVARARFVAEGGLQPRELRMPALGPLATAIDARAVGGELAALVLGVAKPVANAALQAYVGDVGALLASRLERSAIDWRFVVVDSPSVAVFALPDGTIILSRGFFDLLGSEDELAAVLAREMMHVRRQNHLQQLRTPAMDTYLRPLDPELDFRADAEGTRLAARAGYDASALVGALERVAAATAQGADVGLLRSTTPSIADRIATLAGSVTADLEPVVQPSMAASRIERYRAGSP